MAPPSGTIMGMWSLWRKWIAYPLGWLFVMALVLGVVASCAAPDRSKASPPMDEFTATYVAERKGDNVSLQVTERITDQLDRYRKGITRILVPVADGEDIGISGIAVEDPDGRPYPFRENTKPNGDIELLIDRNDTYEERDYRAKTFTFIITYEIERIMSDADDIQEIYLNTNGTEWDNGFRDVSAELIVDPSLVGHLTGDMACYWGIAGSGQTCDIKHDGEGTFTAHRANIRAYENMTIAVGFQPGTVADPLPPIKARSFGWWGVAGLVAIGLAALGAALLTRRLVRQPAPTETGIVTQFTPPEDLEPVLATDFLGVPERGAAAHLAWLAGEGFAELTSSQDAEAPAPASAMSPGERSQRRAELQLRWQEPAGRVGEKMDWRIRNITEALFGSPGKERPLSRGRHDEALAEAQELRDKSLVEMGLRKEITFGTTMLTIGYLSLLFFGLMQIWIGLDGLGWYFLAAGVIGVMLLLWAFHLLPAHGRLTQKGLEMQRYLAGLERFVTTSEGERIRWMNSVATAPRDEQSRIDLYEKLLPWAIVFGAENSWRQLLGDMYSRFPQKAERAMPAWSFLTTPGSWDDGGRSNYTRQRYRHGRSQWNRRASFGEGTITNGLKATFETLGDVARGMADASASTRGSGRGWGGGGGGFRGGSRGGGRSGGGRGGGGGGRR